MEPATLQAEPLPEPLADGLWSRRDTETKRAYTCFCAYRDLGPSRSLVEAYRQETGKKAARQSSGHWNTWYRTHEWKLRAEAYDAALDEQKLEAVAEQWRKRGAAIAEEQFQIAEALMEKARNMLRFPLVRETVEGEEQADGSISRTVTVEPARWHFGTAVQLAKAGTEIGRLAAGLPTSATQIRVQALVESELEAALDRLKERLSPEEYERILSLLIE